MVLLLSGDIVEGELKGLKAGVENLIRGSYNGAGKAEQSLRGGVLNMKEGESLRPLTD